MSANLQQELSPVSPAKHILLLQPTLHFIVPYFLKVINHYYDLIIIWDQLNKKEFVTDEIFRTGDIEMSRLVQEISD